MNIIGKKISETRKLKGFTQEELADLSKVNLRTIQRVENNESEPRGKTLSLICDALEIDIKEFQISNDLKQKKSVFSIILNLIYYFLLNLLLAFIIGYLTLDSDATMNSRYGAFLLSFFIPFYIVYLTSNMNPTERLLKFGSGYFCYIFLLLVVQGPMSGFKSGVRTGLFLSLIIAIGVLFYGNIFLKREK